MRTTIGTLSGAAAGEPSRATTPAHPADAAVQPLDADVANPVLFHDPSERPFGCMSQWYAEPDGRFILDGTNFFCAEQAMMAAKADCFGDASSKRAILAEQRSCSRIKALGRQVTNFDPKIWSSRSFDIVCNISLAKFSQNAPLKAVLLSTGNRTIAEASASDRIWGTGLNSSASASVDPHLWPGSNKLGKALMLARNSLRSSAPAALGRPHHGPPPGPRRGKDDGDQNPKKRPKAVSFFGLPSAGSTADAPSTSGVANSAASQPGAGSSRPPDPGTLLGHGSLSLVNPSLSRPPGPGPLLGQGSRSPLN